MTEDFIAFLWQHQYFDPQSLTTHSGDRLVVHRVGYLNSDAGPDFVEARLEIDGLLWVGTVELHIKTSAWIEHRHAQNKSYGSVILHVVWENDLPGDAYPNSDIPLLELKGRVPPDLLDRYLAIQETMRDIPCESQFRQVSELVKNSMNERVLIERLERKSRTIYRMLDRNRGDWEETLWQLTARYFGAKINGEAFQKLAERVPLKLLLKHRNSTTQVEALLFGTANLIPARPDSRYTAELRSEYQFLSKKYDLQDKRLEAIEWKLLRLRPAGFPTVRMSQLASLVCRNGGLFTLLTSLNQLSELRMVLKSVQSPYWHAHYHFGKPASVAVPVMGSDAVDVLIINAVSPILAAYGFRMQDNSYIDKAIRLLEDTAAEKNVITRKWKALGMSFNSSASTQGATEWYYEYCARKRCLKCQVGNALLRKRISPEDHSDTV